MATAGKQARAATKALRALDAAKDPAARVAAVRRLAAEVAELEARIVAEARDAGLTWTEIGALYDMTKQAAQQRFKARR